MFWSVIFSILISFRLVRFPFLRFSLTYFLCLLALLCSLNFNFDVGQRNRTEILLFDVRSTLCACSVLIYSCTYYYHHHLRNLCTERWFASMFKPKQRIQRENSIIFTFSSNDHLHQSHTYRFVRSYHEETRIGKIESMKFVHLFLWTTHARRHPDIFPFVLNGELSSCEFLWINPQQQINASVKAGEAQRETKNACKYLGNMVGVFRFSVNIVHDVASSRDHTFKYRQLH